MAAGQEQSVDAEKRFIDFAQKDYELKVAYLTSHFGRMWTRFNYFVFIEAALIGGKTIFGEGKLSLGGMLFGLGLSLLWYVMGAEDRLLVKEYRDQVKEAGERVASKAWPSGLPRYRSVGELADRAVWRSPVEWRIPAISTTHLAALIPFLVSVAWLVMFLTYAPRT